MRNASLCIFLIMKIAKIIKHEENFDISFACLNKRLVSINRPATNFACNFVFSDCTNKS